MISALINFTLFLSLTKCDINFKLAAYVTLSRIKSLEGLSLIDIDYSKIRANPKVIKFYESLLSNI